MRILQLRFKNLNSLVGEWLIDLSHQAFVADGIFAITGPTGAGKSTILDAMCLALYGRTPRLKNISKSSNEIMSRQTGECFAEIIFETNTGKYRCHWSQHRSRKKAEGELQSPKHEISDVNSGKILESKIRGVAEKIETVTGMDFDRFTRSMLLAQGGFSAFLQADPDQRAPILEQITGTEIYSQISIKVHELRAEQTKKLELLNAELAGMQLLSDEDEKQLKDEVVEKTNSRVLLAEQVLQKDLAISWLKGIANNEVELATLNEQQQNLAIRQQNFQPELDKLERANLAWELSADYAGITVMRHEQARSQNALVSHQQVLPKLEEDNISTMKAQDLANSALEDIKHNQQQTQITINKTRELDLKIQEKQAPIKSAQAGITINEQGLEKLQTQQQSDNNALVQNHTKLSELTDLLAAHKTDEGLIEQLERIRSQFKSLADVAHQQLQKQNQLTDAEQKKVDTTETWQQHVNVFANQQSEFDQLQNNLQQYQQQQTEQLASRALGEWRQQLSKLTERKNVLERSQLSMQALAGFKQDLTKLIEQQVIINSTELSLTQTFNHQTEAANALEREIALLDTQYDLKKKIESYEEARQHLHDGEACPLCGANEHPYAEGSIPVLNDTLINLNKAKADLKLSVDTLSKLNVQLAENNKDRQQNSQQQQEIGNKVGEEEERLAEFFSSLAMGDELTELMLTLSQQENDRQLKQILNIVSDAENLEQQLTTAREVLDKKRTELAEADKHLQQVNHAKLIAEQTVERLTEELANLASQYQTAQQAVLNDVAIYGVEDLTIDTLDNTLQQLTERREQWRIWQKEKGIVEPLIASLTSQINYQSDQIIKLELELKNQHLAFNQLRSESEVLSQQRNTIFADKNPDDEEQRLLNAVEQAEQSFNLAKRSAQHSEQELNKLKHSIDSVTQEMNTRLTHLNIAETAFKQRLFQVDFVDEAQYKAACLSDEARKILQQQAQQLKNEHNALLTRIDDKTTQLSKERAKQITDQSLDELQALHTTLSSTLSEVQQEIGAISQKLKDNEDIQRKLQSRVKEIDAQKRECVRWHTLHELIGSADGKKYRNFAQGLTFEMMIGHANRQLQKMTDRYLLIRDEVQALELNVVDNYQAGETRSTKNLSGGESFIVSLALALGLSQMASKNVRVDSLFLDEGFGTLDEEALDTALETLSGLQQQGKLIGVISHVQVLKERISTQIQISPNSGGRSTMSGPGVSGSIHSKHTHY